MVYSITLLQVAHLKVYQQKELSETLYPVYEGMLSKCVISST